MTELLGRYRLEKVIGVGSFATVHRARDEHLDDVVVIKVLAENHSLNPEVRERFISEGRSLRRVVSPHVVTIHDIGESERQQPYLVLSYADRGTLSDRVARLRSQGWVATAADVLITARSLAAAVEAVHHANLVHRDLSPGNVLLTSAPPAHSGAEPAAEVADAVVVAAGERLVVADLGLSKDLAMNSGLTVAGGTSGFRPPEQDGPGLIDTRADLWAMSQLLLWLCQGAEAALPPELFTALRRSTAHDPDERHPDVTAWLADIEEALRPPTPPPLPAAAPVAQPEPALIPPGPGAPPASGPPAGTRRAERRRRLRMALAGLIAVVVIGVSGFLVGLSLGASPPSSTAEAAIAIDGPDQVGVGQEASFDAVAHGVETWVWRLPSGEYLVDEPMVSITARSTGPAQLLLRARAPDGTDLEIIHDFTVIE